mgnify:CR=1 FL=1
MNCWKLLIFKCFILLQDTSKEEYKKLYIDKYSLKGKHGGAMNFDTQANGMIILHRFNLFKRLESSVYSFEETLRRLLEKIERTEQCY